MLNLSLAPRLLMALRCKVCHQIIDSEQRQSDAVEVALFGAVAFKQCPACKQLVLEEKDPNYRARARRFNRRCADAELEALLAEAERKQKMESLAWQRQQENESELF